jgi:hypothetical protein
MKDLTLYIDNFSKAGLTANEIYPGIFVVEKFLTNDEISALTSQFLSMSEEDWSVQYTESLHEFIRDQYGVETVEEAKALGHPVEIDLKWVDKNALIKDEDTRNSINARLGKIFQDLKGLDLQGAGSIQRQYEGVELGYHIDSLSNPLVAYAAVMYVNGDFNGGELHFPNIDIRFKPEAGNLIIFPSADEYLHGVTPVEAGPVRYALPAFINRRES